ncbi:MAG: TIGR03435 family protein [Candidatus Sulfopaludibacter sp.]|nr:TIGR03435 family protein [Candidatus Sulfopaludibacter sp.]
MVFRFDAAAAIFLAAAPMMVGLSPAAFEAASIKPAAISAAREGGNRSRIEHTPTSLSMWNVGLRECVQWAYGVAPFQIPSEHLSADSYDILARTGAPVPVSELRVMLQELLARRFKLVLHRETRMLPAYELAIAKGGPKLPPPHAGATPVHAAESLPKVRNDSFVFEDASLAEFGQMFGRLRGIDLPVVDRTGIAGTYDIVLKSAPAAAREGDLGALFAIVQEQLGLKLIPAKAPFEVFIVDHAERPSEN